MSLQTQHNFSWKYEKLTLRERIERHHGFTMRRYRMSSVWILKDIKIEDAVKYLYFYKYLLWEIFVSLNIGCYINEWISYSFDGFSYLMDLPSWTVSTNLLFYHLSLSLENLEQYCTIHGPETTRFESWNTNRYRANLYYTTISEYKITLLLKRRELYVR